VRHKIISETGRTNILGFLLDVRKAQVGQNASCDGLVAQGHDQTPEICVFFFQNFDLRRLQVAEKPTATLVLLLSRIDVFYRK